MSNTARLRKKCLNTAIESNIANIEIGSIVTDIPYFDKYNIGNGAKTLVVKGGNQ